MAFKTQKILHKGQLLARGVARHLSQIGFVSIEEFVPASGLRLDIFALGPKGRLWIIECKTSKSDFTSDRKWPKYLPWGDQFFWAVDKDFPVDILPKNTGLIVADSYDALIVRDAPHHPLSVARRKTLIQKFAMKAAQRLQILRDPDFT